MFGLQFFSVISAKDLLFVWERGSLGSDIKVSGRMLRKR